MDDPQPIRTGDGDLSGQQSSDADRVQRKAKELISGPERADTNRRWQAENATAITSSNEWVRKYGLPLAHYRLF